jgi:hypothetical protein
MVETLLKLKPTIEQTIANLDWTTFVNTLHGTNYQKSFTKVTIFQANIGRDEFWDTCAHFVHMVKPVLMSLRAFNAKQPCMRRAWFLMKTLV